MDYTQYKQLAFRRKFWKFFGAEINMTDESGQQPLGVIRMKAWKLREDVRLFVGPNFGQEAFHIHARNIIDISATYDVFDGDNPTPLFSLRRRGLQSAFWRDAWEILDAHGTKTGEINETSGFLAIARRWIGSLTWVGEIIAMLLAFTQQTYRIATTDGQLLGEVVHQKNPVIVKMALDISRAEVEVDPRIPVASVAMLSIIDAYKSA